VRMGGRALLERRSRPRGPGIRCLACDRSLSLLLVRHPFALRCENAHRFTLWDLLDQAFPSDPHPGSNPARSTLTTWEGRARTLQAFSACALRDGHALAAADFQEAADRFERWGKSLATLLARSDPGFPPPEPAPPAD
jgi:hypothetical protein